MSLFPMLAPAAPSQHTGGLFDNIKTVLADPAVKAGLLQAGMAMLNPNPNTSPFSQIFTGIGEGIMANQRYADLETQRQIDANKLASEQAMEERKFGLQAALNNARIAKMASDIQTSQQNASSLASYRAKRGLGSGTDKMPGAWRAFYRQKIAGNFGEAPTAEDIANWKKEFQTLEGAGPAGGGVTEAPAVSAATSAPTDDLARAQQLVDEGDAATIEEALLVLQGLE